MSGAFSIVAHIMGMPVEETVLFGLPPVTAVFGAWWTERRSVKHRDDRDADQGRGDPGDLQRQLGGVVDDAFAQGGRAGAVGLGRGELRAVGGQEEDADDGRPHGDHVARADAER